MNDVRAFQKYFSEYFGIKKAFAFWKGRVALFAILKAMGITEGDEVILPGYTCVMDVNPVKYLGAKAVYVDIESTTYNINTDLLKEKITERTKAIVAQHTYGYPCEMDQIMQITTEHQIPVIEDCCLALGSTYKGKICGSFGKAAYFSFQWNKPMTTGLGGMVITDDEQLANRIQTLRNAEMCQPSSKAGFVLAAQRLVYRLLIYPRTTAMAANVFRWLTKKGLVIGSSSTCEYVPEITDDFFMAMGQAQARYGLSQLRKINANINHRRKMKTLYDKLLEEEGFKVKQIPDYMDPILVRYPVWVTAKEKAITDAPANGVEIGSWFECPLHPIETPMHLYGYEQGACPIAEDASRHVINLPLHLRTNEKTAIKSVKFIKKYQ